MKITAIEQSQYFKKRFVVFVDGAYFSGISDRNLKRLNLLTDNDYEKNFLLKEIIEKEKAEALEYMLNILEQKSATEAELIIKAKKKAFSGSAIEYAISKLYDFSLIDDKAYTERYVSRNCGVKGKRRMAYELKAKGVNEILIDEAFSELEDEYEAALSTAKKRVKNGIYTQKDREKLMRFLLYRGFSYDTVKKVLKSISGEEDNEQDFN